MDNLHVEPWSLPVLPFQARSRSTTRELRLAPLHALHVTSIMLHVIYLCVCMPLTVIMSIAVTTKPSCWAVLPQGNQMSVIAAVEDRLFVLDAFEAVQQVS